MSGCLNNRASWLCSNSSRNARRKYPASATSASSVSSARVSSRVATVSGWSPVSLCTPGKTAAAFNFPAASQNANDSINRRWSASAIERSGSAAGPGASSRPPQVGQSTGCPANSRGASMGCWQWGQSGFMVLSAGWHDFLPSHRGNTGINPRRQAPVAKSGRVWEPRGKSRPSTAGRTFQKVKWHASRSPVSGSVSRRRTCGSRWQSCPCARTPIRAPVA